MIFSDIVSRKEMNSFENSVLKIIIESRILM